MYKVLLFGGTTEGRLLAEALSEKRIPSAVFVASEYGEKVLSVEPPVEVRAGRLEEAAMEELFSSCRVPVLDATHPYAAAVSANIKKACEKAGCRYLRVLRESEGTEGCRMFESLAELVSWLKEQKGAIFSSMGTKEAEALTAVPDFKERVWLRILPDEKNLAHCLSLGYPREHIFAELGPFSEKQNLKHFEASGARILVTKESGKAGGFSEKKDAAKALGMEVAVLRRPREEGGISLSEALGFLSLFEPAGC